MSDRIKVAVVGLGKMGLSHLAMVNAHPLAEAVACDGSGFLIDALSKNISIPLFRDYDDMLEKAALHAVVIATPSRLHAPMVMAALDKGLHIFCEKPFCLDPADSERLARQAAAETRVAQVGYHYRHVGAFGEMKRLLDAGAIGRVTHVLAEAYGPVVLRSKKATWRSSKGEGGGCLYDYAAHPLNLLNWYFGAPAQVSGAVMSSVFSEEIDDEVFATLRWDNGPTAQLSVNWSDESHRKMTTKISLIGTNGRIEADRQECRTYLRSKVEGLQGYDAGWTVKYTTELTEDQWFYLRGEEYSAQLDDFFQAIAAGEEQARQNCFTSAAETDRTMAMILDAAGSGEATGSAPIQQARTRRGWFGRGA